MRDKLKNETDLALYVLQKLNEMDGIQSFKIYHLYILANKSKDLTRSRPFWLKLTALTDVNGLIRNSNHLKQTIIVAFYISKLPNATWVSENLVMDLANKLSDVKQYQDTVNVIDANQILSFFTFLEL